MWTRGDLQGRSASEAPTPQANDVLGYVGACRIPDQRGMLLRGTLEPAFAAGSFLPDTRS